MQNPLYSPLFQSDDHKWHPIRGVRFAGHPVASAESVHGNWDLAIQPVTKTANKGLYEQSDCLRGLYVH